MYSTKEQFLDFCRDLAKRGVAEVQISPAKVLLRFDPVLIQLLMAEEARASFQKPLSGKVGLSDIPAGTPVTVSPQQEAELRRKEEDELLFYSSGP